MKDKKHFGEIDYLWIELLHNDICYKMYDTF